MMHAPRVGVGRGAASGACAHENERARTLAMRAYERVLVESEAFGANDGRMYSCLSNVRAPS